MGTTRHSEAVLYSRVSLTPSLASIDRILAFRATMGTNLGFASTCRNRIPFENEYPIRQPSFSTDPEFS